ncbi:MAG: 5-hydroxyisourate hydrolase-like protein (transthyretin family) [Lentimonas sp.]|jgi:5-hydroxyisourate hydrolase-like protein (transthyretin family)
MKILHYSLLILALSTLIFGCRKENRTKDTQINVTITNAATGKPVANTEFELIQFEKSEDSKIIKSVLTDANGKISIEFDAVKHKTFYYHLDYLGPNPDNAYNNLYINIFTSEDNVYNQRSFTINKGEVNDLNLEILIAQYPYMNIYNENCNSEDQIEIEVKNLIRQETFHPLIYDDPEIIGCVNLYPNLYYLFGGKNVLKKTITQNSVTTVVMDTVELGVSGMADSIVIIY